MKIRSSFSSSYICRTLDGQDRTACHYLGENRGHKVLPSHLDVSCFALFAAMPRLGMRAPGRHMSG